MYVIAAFYRFSRIDRPGAEKTRLGRLACRAGVRGTVLLSPEGVNGTLAGTRAAIDAAIAAVRAIPGFAVLEVKESRADEMPFRRLKVKVKPEIVTMGVPGLDPAARTGRKVGVEDWHRLLDDPDTVVIDTRNDYETEIGSFPGALDPSTASFSDFPAWWGQNRARLSGKQVAMFCTGGIRCEKASAFLLSQGVEDVVQLNGGILRYLEDVPRDQNRWRGECFVFDGRVAVDTDLSPGRHSLCHACGRAVAPEAQDHPAYREGVSCPACIHLYSEDDRARFAERQRQADLAGQRGCAHLAED
ncbi:MAG: rhodanese-related sulfurtransferase [Pseudomonadota bacterium]